MGKGGGVPIHPRCPSLSYSLDWGRLWSLEAHSRYRGEHRLSVFASRLSLAVGRLLSPIVASKWLVVRGWRSAEAHGFLSFTPLFPRARPPPPTSPASHLPPPPSRPICHTPPTSGHLERSPPPVPPQSPQQPPSTPQTPARNCKYPAACLRPTLHNTTGSPPLVWPSTTRPSVRLTFSTPSQSQLQQGRTALRRLLCSRMPFYW